MERRGTMVYRIGYALAALWWLWLCIYNIRNPDVSGATGNANRDMGRSVGGTLFFWFIVFALCYCLWKAIRGPRVAVDSARTESGHHAAGQPSGVGELPAAIDDSSQSHVSGQDSDRDTDIIRYVLENDREPASDRIYFLTLTPKHEWGDSGDWQDVPAPMLDALPSVAGEYRLASGAMLKDNRVLEKASGQEAWMKWVFIKRWISDTQVEVEYGVWCCPSNGGASTVIYQRQGNRWAFKSLTQSWVS